MTLTPAEHAAPSPATAAPPEDLGSASGDGAPYASVTSQPFDPVDAARKIIERAEASPDVKRVTVGVGGLVAICKALLLALDEELGAGT